MDSIVWMKRQGFRIMCASVLMTTLIGGVIFMGGVLSPSPVYAERLNVSLSAPINAVIYDDVQIE